MNTPDAQSEKAANAAKKSEKSGRREIQGGIPYVIAPGVLKKALDGIVPAERPDKFSGNYMETILKMSGGAARAIPPFMKKMQFLTTDGTPTSLYSKFKTDGGRSQAAYEGLRNAFGELFRRNEFIHKADENAVKDAIRPAQQQATLSQKLGLSYQINIILPETENVLVFNAIFRSLRENLLK